MLLTTRLTSSKLVELSPEYQRAVHTLVAELETSKIYQLVVEAVDCRTYRGQTLFDVSTGNCCWVVFSNLLFPYKYVVRVGMTARFLAIV